MPSPVIDEHLAHSPKYAPGHLRAMSTQTLSAKQQAQMENRDAAGKWQQKAHGDVEDTEDVLGLAVDNIDADTRTEAQKLADEYTEDPELAEAFGKFSDHFDDDMVATAKLYASRRLASRGDMTDPMHDSDDLAQDSLVKALEELRKKGGDNIRHPRSWLGRTMKNTSDRMGEGRYHHPNTVALRHYNEKIKEFEQSNGRSMSRKEKNELRDDIVNNWATYYPNMDAGRYRPQPDFDRHTEKNTAVRLDRFDADETGTPHGAEAYLDANYTPEERDEALDQMTSTLSGKNKNATEDQVRQASAAGWALVASEHNAPAVAEDAVSSDYAKHYQKTFGDDGGGVIDAIEQWETGEENEKTAAIFAPFRAPGQPGLSRNQESAVVDTLTGHGRTSETAGRLWKLALDGARR